MEARVEGYRGQLGLEHEVLVAPLLHIAEVDLSARLLLPLSIAHIDNSLVFNDSHHGKTPLPIRPNR